MPPDLLGLFFTSAVLLALSPGPDNLFVLGQALAHGARSGWLVVCGLCSGLVVHTALVTLGVAALLATAPGTLLAVKIVGAVYLLYLAWRGWNPGPNSTDAGAMPQLSAPRLYRRGLIMNLTNPKVSLFFLAFLPQFVDPAYGDTRWQMLMLGLLFIVATIIVFGGIATLAGRYSRQLNRSSTRRLFLHRLISILFGTLALNLLLDFF